MWIIGLVILLAVGTLGIASWLKTAKPEIGSKLAPLVAVEGWVGIVGLAWACSVSSAGCSRSVRSPPRRS